jgi:hydroxyacyl-ACP dehydratase HTD2-like protein with hotdog domain
MTSLDNTQSDWSNLQLPAPIPELVVTPDHTQIFMFSAATWNRHHIHYSKDAALAEGLPDVVVQRALIGNFFARLLTDWLGDAGEIRALSWKVTASAVPGKALHCQGEALAVGAGPLDRDVACDLRITDADRRAIASGSARLRLHV